MFVKTYTIAVLSELNTLYYMHESGKDFEGGLSLNVQEAIDSNTRAIERLSFSERGKVLASGIWDLAKNTASGALLVATGLGTVHGGILLGKGIANFGEDIHSVFTGKKRSSGLQGMFNRFSRGSDDITSFKRNTI